MRILLVEDNVKLCDFLKCQLVDEGFLVDACMNGEDALYFIEQQIHDVILLDRMLPSLDGFGVLTQMRKEDNHTPVILITALGTLEDKVIGLNLGADDYLVKPFAFEELLARIHCVLRRPYKLEAQKIFSLGDISYHFEERLLTGPERSCLLSKREGSLLEILIRNQDQILTRDLLLTKVWGPDSDVENGNLDNYIHFLRRRLSAVTDRITVKTIWGIGYRLEDSIEE